MRSIATCLAIFLSAAFIGCDGGDDGDDDTVVTPVWEEAFPAEDLGWLLAAWGPSADDVFAVGGTPDSGLIMRRKGGTWNAMDIGMEVPLINWVYGFGSDDVMFVGNGGTAVHYDGDGFTSLDTPTEEDLWGVWGAGPDDMWAVGGRGNGENQATILHYDGVAWTKSSTPTLSRPSVFAYFKVWGTASDDVYAVGQRGTLVHWDGSAWSEIETGASEDLISLWGTGPDRIVAIGGRNNGQAVIYDGTSWRQESLAPLAGLNGVWMRTPNVAHICGAQGTVATLNLDTLEYTIEESDTFLSLHGMFGTSDGQLFSVGGSLLSFQPPLKGVALTRPLVEGE